MAAWLDATVSERPKVIKMLKVFTRDGMSILIMLAQSGRGCFHPIRGGFI